MARFINPFTDVGVKRIFGQAIHKELLIDFLNDLLVGEKRITDITFLDKELLPDFSGDRGVIYDIYCTNEDGEQFIVEMQNREQTFFRERALYYLSQAIARQGERGAEWKFNLKAVYGKLRFIFLQLPCFTKEEDECQTDFERWIYVLKNMETFQRLPFKARKSVFEKLEQIVDIASLSKEDRMKYDESIKVYRDHLAVLDFAKQEGLELGMRQGRAEGMAKGIAEGIEQGMAKGIEQGKNEGEMNERLKNARRMKTKGYPIDDIADITGLSTEEINSL